MARRKRGPPISYAEKYRQIKQSKFKVNIPKPTDRYSKTLVSKYHRILFGGFVNRNGKRVHTMGLERSFIPYKGKHQNAIKEVYQKSGNPRIVNGYYPREFGKVKSVSKSNITFQSKAGTTKVLRVSPRKLGMATHEEREKLIGTKLQGINRERLQISFGAHSQPFLFDEESLYDALDDMDDSYAESMGSITITTFTPL